MTDTQRPTDTQAAFTLNPLATSEALHAELARRAAEAKGLAFAATRLADDEAATHLALAIADHMDAVQTIVNNLDERLAARRLFAELETGGSHE